ncbi:branched-chain amino acid ABC transporter permease [Papillibacter cinnamivorans]|uniref:Branched-chain amino acid transport system permease protein n=1 Tax=Papillibacter cinnamivorans DSM 12816 TaxID=1122930 RepID=A0A1W1YV57_9FIRM|nr:branched-chain amino acid ABC transporter permease [Papillibacter cinnamivorans]SMC40016.1 branched-chain amino acid transport system permease protein [Papillibacter cinnamivorans DSM 12816]
MASKIMGTGAGKTLQQNGRKTILHNPYFQFVLFGVIIACVPLLSSAGILRSSYITLVGSVLIYSVAAMGLNLLFGYSGLISLGTAGFMGLAAYMSAYLTSNLGLPFELSLVISIAVPVIIGILIGLASLRMEGLYLAIVTLCVSEVLRKTFEELEVFTNGFSGKTAAYPKILGFLQLNRDTTYVLLVVALVIIMILTYNLVNGQTGRAFHAMRGSVVAAQAMGVNLLKYRLLAFALATAYASLSGVLYVHFIKYTYPSTWTMGMSLNILAVIVIGGLRSIYGTILGAAIVFIIPDLLLKQIPVLGQINGFSYIFSGVLIICVIMFYPNGLIKVFPELAGLFRKKKGKGESNG